MRKSVKIIILMLEYSFKIIKHIHFVDMQQIIDEATFEPATKETLRAIFLQLPHIRPDAVAIFRSADASLSAPWYAYIRDMGVRREHLVELEAICVKSKKLKLILFNFTRCFYYS